MITLGAKDCLSNSLSIAAMANNTDLSVASTSTAWETISSILLQQPDPEIPSATLHAANERVTSAYDILVHHGMEFLVQEWFLETLRHQLQTKIVPGFWSYFQDRPKESNPFASAVNSLHQELVPYLRGATTLQGLQARHDPQVVRERPPLLERLYALISASVLNERPERFCDAVRDFYSRALGAFHSRMGSRDDVVATGATESSGGKDGVKMDVVVREVDEESVGLRCLSCEEEQPACSCRRVLLAFHQINSKLRALGLLERVCAEAVTSLVHTKIKHFVNSKCTGEFETSFLTTLERWLETKVLKWLNLVFSGEDPKQVANPTKTSRTLCQWRDRLQYLLHRTYANVRIRELFNVIVEFPESMAALQDLKTCLEKTDLRRHLVQSLRASFETRLLHPGVNTDDILTQYISSIRALRVLDPSGIILELVCQPVRKYLRTREDTVRCIVSSLTDDSNKDLAEELIKAEPVTMDESCCSEHEEDDTNEWQPDPIDADPARTSKSRRSSDIISMLVNIYGSRELFVNEYRGLLADRILTGFNYDTARELRYLELLKLCFGESQLHHCEVMLKDVADSRRCNAHIGSLKRDETPPCEDTAASSVNGEIDFSAMILSAQFWPNLKEEKLKIPEDIEKIMKGYTESYQVLKGMRTLNWKTNLGLVKLEIELKDRKLQLSVSPVHATIIIHFQDKAKWSVDELSAVMQVPVTALRRKMAFWQSQGVLREETTDTFVLIEEQRGGRSKQNEIIMLDSDEETESAMASAQEQQEEELQVLWSYIVGMLTNLESLGLERIYSMLKMFAMQGPSEFTEHKLRQFLDRKVREQLLVYSAGVYRLPKFNS